MRRAPGFSALFLFSVLVLSPRPGSSQGSNALRNCNSCSKYLLKEHKSEQTFQRLVGNATHRECGTNVIEFTLPRGIICGDKMDSWVVNVIRCINQGRTPCLQTSENQQPRTTTQELPTSTSRTAPPLGLSTQTWTGGTLKPSESTTEELSNIQKTLKATIGLTTTEPDSDQKKNQQLGNEPTSEKDDDVKSKMSQMTIAIISLLLIVLVMTAVGVYVWCQKGSFPHFKKHCVEETLRYQPAPSEEPIP